MPLGVLSSAVAAGGGAAFELIETKLVSSGTPTEITFTSIPATYKHLQLRIVSRWNAGGSSNIVQLRLNTDTGSNYYYHGLTGDGSNVSSSQSNSATFIQTGQAPPSGVLTNTYGGQIIDILDYADANKQKVVRSLFGQANDYSSHAGLRSGLWNSTSAVTSLSIFGNQGGSYFVTGSRLSLYGIKG
jgi:hypothetical protein